MASIYVVLIASLCAIVCDAASLHETGKRDEISTGEHHHHDWAYNLLPNIIGPEHWAEKFPSYCAGNHQSPIDINTNQAVYNESLGPITIQGNEPKDGSTMQLFNNGHSAQVNLNADVRLTSSDLADKYKVAQFHFHWGSNDTKGSEHLMDGKSYPLEMHVVTYDCKRFFSLGAAAKATPDGLAVFSVLFKVSGKDNDDLHPVTDALDTMKDPDASHKTEIPWIDLATLLPSNSLDRYYRYPGSLTTPMCMESVIWTVFAKRQKISEAQLDKFRSLMEGEENGESHTLVNNRRPPQPLNDRVVQKSFQEETTK